MGTLTEEENAILARKTDPGGDDDSLTPP